MPYIIIILSQQLLFFSLHNPFVCCTLFYPSFRLSRITLVFTCFAFHLKAHLPPILQFLLHVSFFFVAQFKSFSYLSFFLSIFSSPCLSIYFSPTSIPVFPVFLALSPLCHSAWPVILWSLKFGIFFPSMCPYFFCLYLYIYESSRVTHKRSEAWLLYLHSVDTAEAYKPYTGRKYFWYCLLSRTIRGNFTIWRQNMFFSPELRSDFQHYTVNCHRIASVACGQEWVLQWYELGVL